MVMKINNVSFDFDPTDYKAVKAIEEEYDEMLKKIDVIEKTPFPQVWKRYEAHVGVIRDYLQKVTGVDVIAGCTSYAKAIGFTKEFSELVKAARAEIEHKYSAKRVR